MKENRKGFSLIELIIAVAILVVLTGLLAPQLLKYIERSRRAVCMNDMETIVNTYAMEAAGESLDKDSAFLILEDIMSQYKGNKKGEYELYATYTGMCRSGGEYQCILSEDFESITMNCSKHGELAWDVKLLHKELSELTFDNSEYGSDATFTYKNLNDYFKKVGDNATLDSEAKSTGGYGSAGSMAGIVANELSKKGINIKNKSWVLYKQNGSYVLCLADKKLTGEDKNQIVECVIYNTDQVIRGTAKVEEKNVSGNKFLVINKGSFTASD